MSISDEQLEQWGEAAERGDYGGGRGPVTRGPIYPVDTVNDSSVSFGFDGDMLALCDAKVKKLGIKRDDLLRHAMVRELVEA
ncbi:hypothetical protein [Bifidobacterium longum]|uniref:Uncharacterized protein n=1 Tax=Bifidobacterium longum subsp. longum TaxID=1679 RepID=A0A9Q8QXC9_BIFLL|nr:hypothetical protein [Bifidobacterium longum]UNL64532.1 hypothetical protein G8B15_00295 [Bifidobacterium longum subsp. longum]UNL68068.1 hypothetical protein G8B14_09440 [Bifidobacterium longum subsp. longum]UNL70248.1 hypothetical protein G8B13_10500 [Bifidobacterium longum subsp. longum]UNL71634.1 hypothetical protein G8B12_06985 [Bifidobacterium longum subsp. longum]UNL82634.1 hypothetical protein G8B11_10480 [Bifidobacterium longum subsp. longum]